MRRRSRSGDERLWSALAHLAIFPVIIFLGLGLLATLAIFFYKRKASAWLASQALQALAFQSIIVFAYALILQVASPLEQSGGGSPTGGWPGVVRLLAFFYGAMGAIRCALGFNFRYPYLGAFIQSRLRVNED